MTHDDSDIARLLAAARKADLPDAARLARVRARLPQPSAAGGSGAHAPTALRGLGVKVGTALLVVGAVAFVYRQTSAPPAVEPATVQRQPVVPPQPAPIAAQDASPVITPADAPPVAPHSMPTTVQPAKHKLKPRADVAPQPSAVAKPAPPLSTLNEEAALLRLATLATRACRLDEAQASLAKFTERYPHSQLNAERDRLSVSTRELARSGRCKP